MSLDNSGRAPDSFDASSLPRMLAAQYACEWLPSKISKWDQSGTSWVLDFADVSKGPGYPSQLNDLGWWTHKGSNLGPLPCEGNALPLSYASGIFVREQTRYIGLGAAATRPNLRRF